MVICSDNNVLEDIEDVSPDTSRLYANKSKVVPKITNHRLKIEKSNAERIENLNGSIIPGTQRIYMQTWGCSHNSSDSEYMAGQLAAFGYQISDDCQNSDLWLLNSCTVKNPAEDHFRNMIKKAQDLTIPVVVAGCVPQAAPRQEYTKGLSLIGVQQIDRVVEVVEETLKGNTVRLFGQKKENGRKTGGARLDLPKIRRNPLIEIISVNTGCLNACTYCKTKHARGELGSYSIEEITQRAEQSFKEGVVEIWLTSEDTGAYGRDIGVSLPQLLWELVKVIPEGCMLRVGMTNPPYILEHLEEMAKILNHPRVYAFMHVPVQAGSNRTLYEMRREYTQEDFCNVVDFLQSKVPGISIATDIICGFPTETEEDFEETMKLCEKYKFPSLFMNQFFPRPGTPAAKMPQINRQEIKKRTKRLSELFQSYKPYEHKLGTRQTVLVTEISHDRKHFVGHNKYYEQVLISMEEDLMGKMFDVDIYETGKHFLKGSRVKDSEASCPGLSDALPKGQISGFGQVSQVPEDEVLFMKGNLKAIERYLPMILLMLAVFLSLAVKYYNKYIS
ncbi:threonylcarbamoyladenosine tRNA methylthiotransferase-like [Styela clava]